MEEDQEVTPQESGIDANSQQPADRFSNQQKGQDKSSAANELAAKLKDTAVKELASALKKKVLSSAFWSVVGPYIVPISIGIVAILIIGLGLMLLLKGGKGYFGVGANEPVSYASSTDMANMEMLLKDSVSVGGDLKSWYFSQNDKRWGSVVLPTWSKNFDRVGCVVTSWTMIARFYGIETNPLVFGKKCSDSQDSSCYKSLITKMLKEKEISKEVTVIKKDDYKTIMAVLAGGNPIVIRANGLSGASSMHNAVIVGFNPKTKELILNDPEFGAVHKAAYEPSSIEYLYFWKNV